MLEEQDEGIPREEMQRIYDIVKYTFTQDMDTLYGYILGKPTRKRLKSKDFDSLTQHMKAYLCTTVALLIHHLEDHTVSAIREAVTTNVKTFDIPYLKKEGGYTPPTEDKMTEAEKEDLIDSVGYLVYLYRKLIGYECDCENCRAERAESESIKTETKPKVTLH